MQPSRAAAFVAVAVLFLSLPQCAPAQFLVDCSGNTPGAYTTINAVLPLLTDGASIEINGTCQENVFISGLNNLWIGAPFGQTATLHGNLSLHTDPNLFLYGLTVTGSSSNGIDVSNSLGVTLDTCSAIGNASIGLNVADSSSVNIQNASAFDTNGNYGIWVSGSSNLEFGWNNGPFDISNNIGGGIEVQRAVISAFGNMTITNNKASASPLASFNDGFGIDFKGAATGVFYQGAGPLAIAGNQSGGVSIAENSEISLASVGNPTVLQANGPLGISVGSGSQLTLYGGVQVTAHTDAGVDLFAHSQAYLIGPNQITGNGSGLPSSTRGGLRIDGNSEAYIRGAVISQNGGPGILALVNSSIDLSGVSFSSNTGGSIQCDSSAWMVTDLTSKIPALSALMPCKVPNSFGTRNHPFSFRPRPDTSRFKANEARYQQLMSIFKRN